MAFDARAARLFGFDLSRISRAARLGWDGVCRWPIMAWASQPYPVQVCFPDDSRQVGVGASFEPLAKSAPQPEFLGVLLPDDLVLSHQLRFPHLADTELSDALHLKVQSLSPFPEHEVVWGWRLDGVDEGGLTVTLAFAARTHVDAFLAARAASLASGAPYEVWADVNGGIVFRGFGEPRRERAQRRRQVRLLVSLAVTAVLIALLSTSHFWQLRARVFDAQSQFAELQANAAPIFDARNVLAESTVKALAVSEYLDAQADMPRLLASLTELLPDSAWLSRLDVEGRRVRIAGHAADAAGLMEVLRAYPDFTGLRALSPITRGRDGLDSFSLEFVVSASGGES